jgi:hypothetical protein
VRRANDGAPRKDYLFSVFVTDVGRCTGDLRRNGRYHGRSTGRALNTSARLATTTWYQSSWIRLIQRVVPGERVGLSGLGHVRIDAQELPGLRLVVAPY